MAAQGDVTVVSTSDKRVTAGGLQRVKVNSYKHIAGTELCTFETFDSSGIDSDDEELIDLTSPNAVTTSALNVWNKNVGILQLLQFKWDAYSKSSTQITLLQQLLTRGPQEALKLTSADGAPIAFFDHQRRAAIARQYKMSRLNDTRMATTAATAAATRTAPPEKEPTMWLSQLPNLNDMPDVAAVATIKSALRRSPAEIESLLRGSQTEDVNATPGMISSSQLWLNGRSRTIGGSDIGPFVHGGIGEQNSVIRSKLFTQSSSGGFMCQRGKFFEQFGNKAAVEYAQMMHPGAKISSEEMGIVFNTLVSTLHYSPDLVILVDNVPKYLVETKCPSASRYILEKYDP